MTVERKDLPDLIHSFTTNRAVFVKRLRRMSGYPHRLLVVTAALSEVKSPYGGTSINPNRITQSLIAALAGLGVRALGDARAGRGNHGVVFVSGAALPLAGSKRLRAEFGGRGFVIAEKKGKPPEGGLRLTDLKIGTGS